MELKLIYKDITTGEQWLLYTLKTNMSWSLDEIMEHANLTVKGIESQLGFKIDYENLVVEIRKESETYQSQLDNLIYELEIVLKDEQKELTDRKKATQRKIKELQDKL